MPAKVPPWRALRSRMPSSRVPGFQDGDGESPGGLLLDKRLRLWEDSPMTASFVVAVVVHFPLYRKGAVLDYFLVTFWHKSSLVGLCKRRYT